MAGLSRQYRAMPIRQETLLNKDGSDRLRKTKDGKKEAVQMVVTEVTSKSKDFRHESNDRANNRRRKRMDLPVITEKIVNTGEATITLGTPKILVKDNV